MQWYSKVCYSGKVFIRGLDVIGLSSKEAAAVKIAQFSWSKARKGDPPKITGFKELATYIYTDFCYFATRKDYPRCTKSTPNAGIEILQAGSSCTSWTRRTRRHPSCHCHCLSSLSHPKLVHGSLHTCFFSFMFFFTSTILLCVLCVFLPKTGAFLNGTIQKIADCK